MNYKPSRCLKTKKVRFRRKNALKHARKIQKRHSKNMRTYLCEYCKSWHLTTMSKKEYADVLQTINQ